VQSGTLEIGPAGWLVGGSYQITGFPVMYADGAHIEPGATVLKDDRGVCWNNVVPATTIHTVGHPSLIQDYPYTVRVFGPRNGFSFLGVGSSAMTPTPFAFGDLWIEPPSLNIIGLAPLDGVYGEYNYSLYCPRSVPEGHVYAFQAAMLAPNGTIVLTPPSQFTVAWAFGRVR
jgi:hypothetical protein